MALRAYNFPRQPPPVGGEQHSPLSGWFDLITQRFRTMENLQNFTASGTPQEEVFWIRVDASGGARTITLPSAVTRDGKKWGVLKTDSTTNAVTVDPEASETIGGSATITLFALNDAVVFVSNGTNWDIVSMDTRVMVGSFTRDLTTATGTVVVTGLGSRPKGLIFVSGITGGSYGASVGFSDGVTQFSLETIPTLGNGMFLQSNAGIVRTTVGLGDYQAFSVSAIGVDGFTASFTKIGLPTGTGTFGYTAIR